MSNSSYPDILYTIVDEAPELASASLLPIVLSFAALAGINVGSKDISLAGRIKATFGKYLKDDQKQDDGLKELGEIVLGGNPNIWEDEFNEYVDDPSEDKKEDLNKKLRELLKEMCLMPEYYLS